MRTWALTICAALAASPAIGQVADNDAAAEVIDNLLDGVRIIRCDAPRGPLYLPFTKDAAGNEELAAWYLDGEVGTLGTFATVTEEDRVLMISKQRLIVITDDGAEEFECRSEGLEIRFLLTELRLRRK
ncbi:MAG: hypothetical protein CML46_05045 [Rhodobacteraceae bacterium]|nr:hypothetical protein [Paracoccaceae bacterium]MBR26300.1 hypothetical protein [Paracoccaceae bacterium]